MKKYILIMIGFMVLMSCEKNIQYDVNIDSEIFINAEFIDSLSKQKITVYKNIPIKNPSVFNPVKDAELSLKQLGNTYAFSASESGIYFSDMPFLLEGGKPYTVTYKVDTTILNETYMVPHSIHIDSLYTDTSDFFRDVFISIESPIKQYFIYKLYQKILDTSDVIDPFAVDSIWDENPEETRFQILELKAGPNNISLPVKERYNITDAGSTIKVVITVISKQTRDYFLILNDYFETIATSSLYVNPPQFYSNHFYGVTYAFSRDSSSIIL